MVLLGNMKNETARQEIRARLKQKRAEESAKRQRDREYDEHRRLEIEHEERGENYWAGDWTD